MARVNEPTSDKAAREARRVRVAELLLAGHSQDAIALLLGVSQATISKDAALAMERWKADANRDTGALVALENERLNALLAAVFPLALAADPDAVRNALAIAARRAKMLGLDQAQKVDMVMQTEEDLSVEKKLERWAENLATAKDLTEGWAAEYRIGQDEATEETDDDGEAS